MAAGKYDIIIEKGSTWGLPIIVQDQNKQPIDLTGYYAQGSVRKGYKDVDVIVSFAQSGTLDSSGSFSMTLSASQTAALPVTPAIYDIQLFQPTSSGGYNFRLLEGSVLIKPAVTRM
jgi:hypothetical protein